jgi:hypothetical protein
MIMDNKIVLFDNNNNQSSFIDSIIYDYGRDEIEVRIKGKVYIYPNFHYNQIRDIVDCIENYGAGKAYNWLIKSKNFVRV